MTGIEQLKRRVDDLTSAGTVRGEDLAQYDTVQDEELADLLLSAPDPDAPGTGITTLSNRRLAELLCRSPASMSGTGDDAGLFNPSSYRQSPIIITKS
jgi:hypothetical protein